MEQVGTRIIMTYNFNEHCSGNHMKFVDLYRDSTYIIHSKSNCKNRIKNFQHLDLTCYNCLNIIKNVKSLQILGSESLL